MYDIKLQIRAPELTDAINRLVVAMAGGKTEAPAPTLAEPDSPTHITATAGLEAAPVSATFQEIHTALLDLKTQKKAAAVREVLTAVDAKTVQDIPPEKFGEVLQLVKAKLEG